MKGEDEPGTARAKLTRSLADVLARVLSLPRVTTDVRVDVRAMDIVSAEDTTQRETVLLTTVRNFSDFPLHLATVSYEKGRHDGLVVQRDASLLGI